MALKGLLYSTVDEAKERSRAAWEAVLGRPKNPEDVTEFLFPVEAVDGGAIMYVDEAQLDRLTPQEVATLQDVAVDVEAEVKP